MTEYLTRAEVAARLRVSERTLRRHLPKVRNLKPVVLGRTVLFTRDDFSKITQAFTCQSTQPAAAPASIMPAARFASAPKPSRSPSSAQDAARSLMQTLLPQPRTRKSAKAY